MQRNVDLSCSPLIHTMRRHNVSTRCMRVERPCVAFCTLMSCEREQAPFHYHLIFEYQGKGTIMPRQCSVAQQEIAALKRFIKPRLSSQVFCCLCTLPSLRSTNVIKQFMTELLHDSPFHVGMYVHCTIAQLLPLLLLVPKPAPLLGGFAKNHEETDQLSQARI